MSPGMVCGMFGVACQVFGTPRRSKLSGVCSVAPKAELPRKAAVQWQGQSPSWERKAMEAMLLKGWDFQILVSSESAGAPLLISFGRNTTFP